MRFGVIGLGRIGGNLALQALEKGHEVVGHSRTEKTRSRYAEQGVETAETVEDLVSRLPTPRVVLLYLPHGDPLESNIVELRRHLARGDVIVDGGNTHWEHSERRHRELAEAGIGFIDAGTSGGVEGARHGANFQAGGEPGPWSIVEPLLRDLAVEGGATRFGPPGSGHFAKLVHNAIEFGMVQAIAEGIELLERSGRGYDVPQVLDNWANGSVLRSWLVELQRDSLRAGPDLDELTTRVDDTGEVKWVLEWALEQDVPTPVITDSQQALMNYRDPDAVQAKAHALLRNAFGQHPVHRRDE